MTKNINHYADWDVADFKRGFRVDITRRDASDYEGNDIGVEITMSYQPHGYWGKGHITVTLVNGTTDFQTSSGGTTDDFNTGVSRLLNHQACIEHALNFIATYPGDK